MRVALDARMIDYSGIGVAIEGWLEGFAALGDGERPELVLIGDPERLEKWSEALGAQCLRFESPVYSLREQLLYPASRGRWDLLHVPHYAYPVLHRGPIIVTVHDLFHIKYGGPAKAAYQSALLNRLRARGCPVLTVSEHSRTQLIERAGFPAERVTAVPHGISASLAPLDSESAGAEFRRKRALPERYFLWIGIAQPHKNLEGLLEALSRVYQTRRLSADFVLAGLQVKDLPAVRANIARRGLTERVRLHAKIPRKEIPALFAGALALITPSLDEGFGFPPLEAMAMGVPAAISDLPPMRDHCGDAALRFDPADPDSIGEAICRLESDQRLRSDLIARGLKRASRFRWPETARKLARAYSQTLAQAIGNPAQ